jgi:NAD(P)-dependent dehydrogenase (short-subunit alcohol dehydrogenase family)
MTGTRVALVTGASSGIGEATALRLAELGFTVYAAARRVDRMAALAQAGVRIEPLDVTDDASMVALVKRIVDETGRIDVLVNNAGYGSYGAIEDVPLDEARRQFEVNVFGLGRMTQLVLPHLRARRSGYIVNISSIGGKIYTPLGGWYHATKFAVEGLSDALRAEVAPFGIKVVVVEPGAIATEWSGISADGLEATSAGTAYADQARVVSRVLRSTDASRMASPPQVVANAIGRVVNRRRPPTRVAVGGGARGALALRRLLPDRAFDAALRRLFRAMS